jgi:predicted transglutaminase-like cysteine proteinase
MKSQSLFTTVVTAVSFLTCAGGASALPVAMSKSAIPTSRAFLAEGEAELAPLAHVKFCIANAEECAGGSVATRGAVLDGADVPLLDRVNREVNRRIRPRAKLASIGQWAINPSSGDCNDYAVTKRHMLVALGLPASALRLAVVRTSWGEGHLVLVARMQDGDYVLDNLSNRLVRWSETGHSFLKIQSASDARNWTGVEPAGSFASIVAVAATSVGGGGDEDWYLGEP